MSDSSQLAVIGGGIAGAAFARAAVDAGADVVVFDKARGLGGRMSTRRASPFTFDHGAQYFTTQATLFRREVARWAEAGTVATWDARLVRIEDGTWQPREDDIRRWVGTPSMNSPIKHVLEGLPVHRATRIESATRRGRRWHLVDSRGQDAGLYDALVVATPAAQAIPLLRESPRLAAVASSVRVAPCWAVMLAFGASVPAPYDAATVTGSALTWVARDSTKPGRAAPSGGETWVLHASPAWSRAHVDDDPERVGVALFEAFRTLPGAEAAPAPRERFIHRWLYARVEDAAGVPHLWDAGARIGACGDWCLGPRVEEAWTSGRSLADAWVRG